MGRDCASERVPIALTEGRRLVATSSLASLFAMPRGEHYAATKAALNALVRALAVEHARYGITANAILPGWIETEMTCGPHAQREVRRQAEAERLPMTDKEDTRRRKGAGWISGVRLET